MQLSGFELGEVTITMIHAIFEHVLRTMRLSDNNKCGNDSVIGCLSVV
jgi:hypothetical protein